MESTVDAAVAVIAVAVACPAIRKKARSNCR
jgi:hypothetical protein